MLQFLKPTFKTLIPKVSISGLFFVECVETLFAEFLNNDFLNPLEGPAKSRNPGFPKVFTHNEHCPHIASIYGKGQTKYAGPSR